VNIVLRRPILLSLPPYGGHPNGGAGPKNGKRSDRGYRRLGARNAQQRAGGAPRPSGRGLRTGRRERPARPAGGRVDATRHYPGTTSTDPTPVRTTLPGSYSPDLSAQFGPKDCTFRTDFPENGRIRVSGSPKGVSSMVSRPRFSFLSQPVLRAPGPPQTGVRCTREQAQHRLVGLGWKRRARSMRGERDER
jgi:hypothetical protein